LIGDGLAKRVAALADERIAFVQATVVRAGRPASVRPGATALVLGDGTIEGFVGGHCAEPSVRLHAARALETGEALLLRIEPGDGSGTTSEGAVTEHNPCLSGGALEIFLEPHLPAPRLLVIGDTPIAHALADLGRAVGYAVVAKSDGTIEPTDNDAAVIVASHGRDEDRALATALEAGVPYVALVASRKRGEAVVADLDVGAADRARVHTPAGLDIGARTPAEIALSILAEIVASRRPQAAPVPGDHERHE
jgi:xanthine dehydrogenase accessory factor